METSSARTQTEFSGRSISPRNDWLVWQLADSAFPTGGFAHSAGLEAAWQQGEIRTREALADYLVANLDQLAHGSIPFVTAAHQNPESLAALDRRFDAFTSNHVANRASRAQGRAFLQAAERIFEIRTDGPPFAHYAPVFGFVCRHLELAPGCARELFVFVHLRTLVSSAVRLGVIGPMEAQRLQHQLTPAAREVLQRCDGIAVEEATQTSPIFDLLQGAQDRLYSRLFQS